MDDETVSCKVGPRCPYCGRIHNEPEDYDSVVTYWGEDGSTTFSCHSCELDFSVNEVVSRYWESMPIVQKIAKP